MNNLILLRQLISYLDEAAWQEEQPVLPAWRTLCCEDFAVEVLLTPTARLRCLSHVCTCVGKHGAERFAWLTTSACCQHDDA